MDSLSQLAFVFGDYPFAGHAQARLVISVFGTWDSDLRIQADISFSTGLIPFQARMCVLKVVMKSNRWMICFV